MTGLFQRALGDDWDDLHPELRDRYGLVADDGRVAVGRGRMTRLSTGAVAWPALWLATHQNFLFPEGGADVPFEIYSHAVVDGLGNEAIFFDRRFDTDPRRRFVDVMRWNPRDDCVTNFFGRDGHVVSNLDLSVEGGGVAIEIGAQWLRVGGRLNDVKSTSLDERGESNGGRYLRFPGFLAADGSLRDWYDDYAGEFRVGATITTPLAGHLFGYQGTFQHEWCEAASEGGIDPSRLDAPLPTSDG